MLNADKYMSYNNQNQNQAQNYAQDKIFSKMLRAGGKNYFFDVKKASNGSNYLTISESYKKQTGEQVVNRIMLFRDHMQEFQGVLQEVGVYLN